MIQLPYTFLDILNALYHARKKGKLVMLVLPRDQDCDLDFWSEVLEIQVLKGLYNYDRQQVRGLVRRAKEEGAVIVGGTFSIQYAESIGAESYQLLPSRENILQTMRGYP